MFIFIIYLSFIDVREPYILSFIFVRDPPILLFKVFIAVCDPSVILPFTEVCDPTILPLTVVNEVGEL
jgi:hypothetical protein